MKLSFCGIWSSNLSHPDQKTALDRPQNSNFLLVSPKMCLIQFDPLSKPIKCALQTTKTVFSLLFCYASSMPLIHHLFQSQIQFWKPQNESHFKKMTQNHSNLLSQFSYSSLSHNIRVYESFFEAHKSDECLTIPHGKEKYVNLLWRLWMWNKWMRFKILIVNFFLSFVMDIDNFYCYLLFSAFILI